LVQASESPIAGDAVQVAPYLDILDRAVEDRMLSPGEQAELAAIATTLGLNADRVRRIHADYVATLAAIARRDGVVTEREEKDLDAVATALGVTAVGKDSSWPIQKSTASEDGGSSIAGSSVCFTGKLLCSYEGELMTRELAENLAVQAGLIVAPRVTKSVDILVVADPNSMSGKARKAREYGIRIISEASFWSIIGVEVS
jgi:DNA polymerase-3 subunit epsilon